MPVPKGMLACERSPKAKLTYKDVQEIRRLYADKELSQHKLAIKYGVNQRAIWSIVHYETWTIPIYIPKSPEPKKPKRYPDDYWNIGNVKKRFWNMVGKSDSCWLWSGRKDQKGYGIFNFLPRTDKKSRHIGAHRASYIFSYGDIDVGLHVCHHCDNPSCVRPDYLFLGTNADNQHDRWNKGRKGNARRKLSDEQVASIITLYKQDSSHGSKTSLARLYGVSRAAINYILKKAA